MATASEKRYSPFRYLKRANFEPSCLGDPGLEIDAQRILQITGYASLAEMNDAMNTAPAAITAHKFARLFISGINYDECCSPLDPIDFDGQTYVLPSPFSMAASVKHHFEVYGFSVFNDQGNLRISCNVGIEAPGLLKPSSPEASCICSMLTDDSDWAEQLGLDQQNWLSINKVPRDVVRDVEFVDSFRVRLRDRIEQILWIGGSQDLVNAAEEDTWISVIGEETIGLEVQVGS